MNYPTVVIGLPAGDDSPEGGVNAALSVGDAWAYVGTVMGLGVLLWIIDGDPSMIAAALGVGVLLVAADSVGRTNGP